MIENIKKIEDLKKLDIFQKKQLAEEIREYIIDTVSKCGGHLASNLGVVELTIALESVLDMEKDKIIWDVGHQVYTHKILNGRYEEFKNLRKLDSIAGFPKISESKTDTFNTGHSATSISAALGIAVANKLKNIEQKVVAVIGDGALTGGLAYEGLENAGTSKANILIILNDNEMSISKNVGGLNRLLTKLRTKKHYVLTNTKLKNVTSKIPYVGKKLIKICHNIKWSVKQLIIPKMFFEDIGFKYFGVVDGHNIEELEQMLKLSLSTQGPAILHINTKKGKGYKFAEENPDRYHSTSPFDIKTGQPISTKKKDYSKVFGQKLTSLAELDEKIVAITAAMVDGTGLRDFANKYPNRLIDVGIAEQHALTFAAGLASQGIKPVVSIYSSFYQRGYDQVIHDIAIQNLGVVMCIDRAGLVGQDGETHQGLYDLAMFRIVPNLVIMAPKNFDELEDMLEFALNTNKPICLRYPRGSQNIEAQKILDEKYTTRQPIELGKCEILKSSLGAKIQNEKKIVLIGIGNKVGDCIIIQDILEKQGIEVDVVNVRFLKPLDKEILQVLEQNKNIVTVEDGTIVGGLASAIDEVIVQNMLDNIVLNIGYVDKFIEHGTIGEIEKRYGIDVDSIIQKIEKKFKLGIDVK